MFSAVFLYVMNVQQTFLTPCSKAPARAILVWNIGESYFVCIYFIINYYLPPIVYHHVLVGGH